MSFLNDLMASNPYFAGGAGLIGITAGLAVLRQGLVQASGLARQRLFTTLEIPSNDKSYSWFLQWMASNQRKGAMKRMFNPALSVETSVVKHDNGATSARFELVPGPGRHFFKYRSAWFAMERTRERQMLDLTSGTPWETVTLTTLTMDRHLFAEMLQDAKALALTKEEGKTVIYTSYGPEWRPFGQPRKRRPIQSVVLDEGISEKILKDVKDFIGNGKWYADRGIPYRRGYLFYGVPGSGKSSFIQALAGELQFNICLLNLSERGLTDDRLNHLLSHAPPRSIILLEDIDAAFVRRDPNEKQGFTSTVTFSGLLNALDGVAAAEERLVFMTTNHVDLLDPALIRPGRADVRQEFGHATAAQIRGMFLRFYPTDPDGKLDTNVLADEFVTKCRGLQISTAQLQGHFTYWRDDPRGAVNAAGDLLQST
ncbi:BCS1 N terminal-domain-containing protein [Hyaloraphidium curvatum]|nr:BCS1 N terminal-domain-containing protein [Hyaloraphidium curvatum]